MTGSDGKTTTATMLAGLLTRAGKRVYLGGNIGRSLLPFLEEMTEKDACVLELSSFQLSDMECPFYTGVVTNLTPNHLNYVEFVFDAERIFVLADMDAIYQVVYNLCDNAVKFSKDNGCLRLSVKEKNGKVTVSVYNEGQGISEEDLKFVFDRFYKVDKSRGIDKSGTGLGLYISKKIIEAHKETIYAESEYQKSCTFSFTLQKGENTGRRYHAK